MPTGLVENHHRKFVLGKRFREAIEESLHGCGIDIGHDQREGIVCPRFDSGEDIGESEALVAKAGRALAPLPPDMTGAAFLPDPRFILEKQPDALITVRVLNYFQQQRGSF